MPELPDVTLYVEALDARITGHKLNRTLIRGPFLLRSVAPPVDALHGKTAGAVRRVGKRIAIGFEGDLWLVLAPDDRRATALAGDRMPNPPAANVLALFEFDSGTLTLTEAGTQQRASLHVVAGEEGLRALDPGGIEVLEADRRRSPRAKSANHTLKRALTDPRLFSGIGNAYSDEILHRARLSPIALTARLTPAEIERLHAATRDTLVEWTDRLRAEARGEFPEKVTAFREGMAVHGRYRPALPALRRARCSAFVTREMKPTTAPAARPAESCWRIAPFPSAGRGLAAHAGRVGSPEAAPLNLVAAAGRRSAANKGLSSHGGGV